VSSLARRTGNCEAAHQTKCELLLLHTLHPLLHQPQKIIREEYEGEKRGNQSGRERETEREGEEEGANTVGWGRRYQS
jgi:hypothetical protein